MAVCPRRYPFGPTSGSIPRDGAPASDRIGSSAKRDQAGLARRGEGVDEAVVDGLLGGEDLVALDVLADLVDVFAGVPSNELLEQRSHPEYLVGLDLDVTRLPVRALGVRLVDEHSGVGHSQALARRAGGQQHGGRGRRLAHADRAHVGLDELHRVVDGRHRRERAAGELM